MPDRWRRRHHLNGSISSNISIDKIKNLTGGGGRTATRPPGIWHDARGTSLMENRWHCRAAATRFTAAAAVLCLASIGAKAQDTTPAHRQIARIHWQLTVLQDGQSVDQLDGDTAIGQSSSITHHRAVSHPVGCSGAQTVPVDLTRTITVSPLGVDSNGVIGFAVTADEMVESPASDSLRTDGCELPPATRTVSARHPELDVPNGGDATWTLLKKDPALAYRLQASVDTSSSDR